MALFRLACAALGGVLFVREKLKLILVLQSIFFVMVALSLVPGWTEQSPVLLVSFLSVSGCLFYLLQALGSYRLSATENSRTT